MVFVGDCLRQRLCSNASSHRPACKKLREAILASLKFDSANCTGIIQFTYRDEDRKTFRLSNVSKTTADRYLNHISYLNDA